MLIALHADFPILIRPQPARVIAIEVSAPPPLLVMDSLAEKSQGPGQAPAATRGGGGNRVAAAALSGNGGASVNAAAGVPFLAPASFSLKAAPPPGAFTLAPASGRPAAPAAFGRPGGAPRLGRYAAAAYDPGAMMAGAAAPGGVALIPFNAREKTVAAWTEAVLTRIERNWLIPLSVRLAFSGQVQITLTIEKNGSRQSLVLQDPSLPESLTQPALQAIKASLPLPPLPENVAGQTFAFTFIFDYNG